MRIGLFDSGIGGLTVLREIWKQCPGHSTIYLGDTARVPYGTKSPETVKRYAFACARTLMELGAERLVVACNTASAHALNDLQSLSVPVMGVVQPGAKAALATSRTQRIGVLGTPSTIRSEAYRKALAAMEPDVDVMSIACPLFVPLVEEGWENDEITLSVAKKYLGDWIEKPADAPDTIILGCTHYPMLKPILARLLGEGVQLVDSAEAIAKELASELSASVAESEPSHRLYLTDASDVFTRLARRWHDSDSMKTPPEIELLDLSV